MTLLNFIIDLFAQITAEIWLIFTLDALTLRIIQKKERSYFCMDIMQYKLLLKGEIMNFDTSAWLDMNM